MTEQKALHLKVLEEAELHELWHTIARSLVHLLGIEEVMFLENSYVEVLVLTLKLSVCP